MGQAESEYHEKMQRLGEKRDAPAVTARSASDLAAVARAADNGSSWEWHAAYPQRVSRVGDVVIVAECFEDPDSPSVFAEYIATFDPPTVLKLVERLEAAEAENKRLDRVLVLETARAMDAEGREFRLREEKVAAESQVAALTKERDDALSVTHSGLVTRITQRAEAAEAALAEARTQRARMYLRLRDERERLADTRRALEYALANMPGHSHWREGGAGGVCEACERYREVAEVIRRALAATGGGARDHEHISMFADESWYIERPEPEVRREGVLTPHPHAVGPASRGGLNFKLSGLCAQCGNGPLHDFHTVTAADPDITPHDFIPDGIALVYSAGVEDQLARLVGCPIVVRGKLVRIDGVVELWIGRIEQEEHQ